MQMKDFLSQKELDPHKLHGVQEITSDSWERMGTMKQPLKCNTPLKGPGTFTSSRNLDEYFQHVLC